MRRTISLVVAVLCVLLVLDGCKAKRYPLYHVADQIDSVSIVSTGAHTMQPKSIDDLGAIAIKTLDRAEIDKFISEFQTIDCWYIGNDASYSVEGLGILITYSDDSSQIIGLTFGFYDDGTKVKNVFYGLEHDAFTALLNRYLCS